MLKQEAKVLKADADVLEFYIINDDILNTSDVIACTLVGASSMLRGKRYQTVFH